MRQQARCQLHRGRRRAVILLRLLGQVLERLLVDVAAGDELARARELGGGPVKQPQGGAVVVLEAPRVAHEVVELAARAPRYVPRELCRRRGRGVNQRWSIEG